MARIWLIETLVSSSPRAFETSKEASQVAAVNRKMGFTSWVYKATIDKDLSRLGLAIALINNPRSVFKDKQLVRAVHGLKKPRGAR